VDDMDGYGRPLEALADTLAAIPNLENFDVDQLLYHVVAKLAVAYPDVREAAKKLVPAVLYVLMRRSVSREDKLEPGELTAEQVVEMGLFEYDQDKETLNCPFVLLCLLSQWSNDHTLAHLDLPSYNPWKGDKTIPNTGRFWQDWEEFLVQFRVLKSKLYGSASKYITFKDLHMGAIIGKDKDVLVQEVPAIGFYRAPHIVENDQASRFCSDHPDQVILNAPTAPASDLFRGLKVKDEGYVVEHTQAKHTKVTTTINKWKAEEAKAAKTSKAGKGKKGAEAAGKGDFFLLFTTDSTRVTVSDLPPRGGIVSSANFHDYFGPYAARAFQAVHAKKHINKCTYEELLEARAVGPKKAKIIKETRDTYGDFKNREDFIEKTGLAQTYSYFFLFDA